MWTITTYRLVSPISLKLATATSTGGKSLLVPTPYAFKMALLDQMIQALGIQAAQAHWPLLRDAAVAVDGPDRITVNNTFTKIMKPVRGQPSLDPDTGLIPSMNHSIAFREYVFWQGDCRIALELGDEGNLAWGAWLTNIGYFGKRGGFVQALRPSETAANLPEAFTLLTATADGFFLDGTLQVMDDCGPEVTFEQVDIYSNKTIKLGKDRILRHVVLPYKVERASRGFTLYTRIDTPETVL